MKDRLQKVLDDTPNPFVMILIGPPLSGKDTTLNQCELPENTVVISRDQILMYVYGSENYDEAFKNVNQKQVDTELQNMIRSSSQEGKNVIINMTNMTSKRRSHNLSYFDDSYSKIAVIFPILEWDEYVLRNEKRQKEEQKFIPLSVIKSMISSYQPISEQEDFDKVISL